MYWLDREYINFEVLFIFVNLYMLQIHIIFNKKKIQCMRPKLKYYLFPNTFSRTRQANKFQSLLFLC